MLFSQIQAGDVLSREKIAIGLENLRKAYGSLGYVNFTSVPETTFDDDNKVVHIDIDVDEGKQFYVSSVDILGLDELARQELLKDLPVTVFALNFTLVKSAAWYWRMCSGAS